MEFTVNGRAIPMEWVTYREMGFSQPASRSMPYRVSIARTDLPALLAPAYRQFAGDEKADAPHRRPGDMPEHDRLLALGYPPLEQLVEEAPDLVEYLLRGRMALAWVLPALIPDERPESRFVINSIDRAQVSPTHVMLEGQGFPV